MNSEKVEFMLRPMRPEGYVLDDAIVVQAARDAGLDLTVEGGKTTLHLYGPEKGSKRVSVSAEIPLILSWAEEIEGATVTWTPFLTCMGRSSVQGDLDPLAFLGPALLPAQKTARLPEPTVVMPLPVWAEVETYDTWNTSLVSQCVFISEARVLAAAFEQRLAEAIAEAEKTA